MKNKPTKNLFKSIVYCENITKCSCCSKRICKYCGCDTIIGLQKGNIWQCPEPWVGYIEDALTMFLSSNPSINNDEVYPITNVYPSYCITPSASILWSNNKTEQFFEERFNPSLPYVDNKRVLLKNGKYSKPVSYWVWIEKYFQAIEKNNNITLENSTDFVLSEIVHCKSIKEKGVSKAKNQCWNHTEHIINTFITNGKETHRIVVVGAKARDMFMKHYTLIKRKPIGQYTMNGKIIPIDTFDCYSKNGSVLGNTEIIIVPHPNAHCSKFSINGVVIKN